MRRILAGLIAVAWIAPAGAVRAANDLSILLPSYLRYQLVRQTLSHGPELAERLPEEDAKQVREAASAWQASRMARIRKDLTAQLGGDAEARFSSFVSEYTTAEEAKDAGFLAFVSEQAGLRPPPSGYDDLRKRAAASWLDPDVREAAGLLAEIQTWADVRAKDPKAPPLSAWLDRGKAGAPGPAAVSRPARPANPLRDAEAPVADFEVPEESPANPLDAFDTLRRGRRDRALEEAQAGMQQVAAEREVSEQELASKKLAAAQADAENMRKQAEKLAASEQEALEQRKNSWGNRIKSIVGATISAGVGAFTGGIGTQAGQLAADAIFN